MGIAAAIAGGSALIGAGSSLYGASMQAGAANNATQAELEMWQTMQRELAPYMKAGGQSLDMLMGRMSGLTAPFAMTQKNLESTPGYKFIRSQGEKAINNTNSTMGWGDSGPGAKGIASFATGLASNTYQQQFEDYWKNNQNAYQMLMGPAQLGESAAAQSGAGAIQTGSQIGSNLIGAGNAYAGGAVGAAGQLSGAPMNFWLMNQLINGGGAGSPPPGGMPWGGAPTVW